MQTIKLCHGVGKEGVSHCVMAATSIVAGEEFSDKPNCVCPVITRLLVGLNDQFPNTTEGNKLRSEILGHLPWLIIGTRGTKEHEQRRAYIMADFAVRKVAAFALFKAGRSDDAYKLWSLTPIVDANTAYAAYDAAYAATYAAYDAAYAAYAAYAAAAAAAAAAAYAAADTADTAAAARLETTAMFARRFVRLLERELIPVHTTMTLEPSFDGLVTV